MAIKLSWIANIPQNVPCRKHHTEPRGFLGTVLIAFDKLVPIRPQAWTCSHFMPIQTYAFTTRLYKLCAFSFVCFSDRLKKMRRVTEVELYIFFPNQIHRWCCHYRFSTFKGWYMGSSKVPPTVAQSWRFKLYWDRSEFLRLEGIKLLALSHLISCVLNPANVVFSFPSPYLDLTNDSPWGDHIILKRFSFISISMTRSMQPQEGRSRWNGVE